MDDLAVVDHGSSCPATKDGIWPHSWSYGSDATGEQECLHCDAVTIPANWTPRCPRCGDDMVRNGEGPWFCEHHHPELARALVALSEDRQWLVVLEHNEHGAVHKERWHVYHYHPHFVNPWHWSSSRDDTGQSADEVLRDWMEGRNP